MDVTREDEVMEDLLLATLKAMGGEGEMGEVERVTLALHETLTEELNPAPDWRRRVGRFTIDAWLVDHRPDDCIAMFAGVMVVRAEWMASKDAIEYVAYSPAFDEIAVGAEPPWYLGIIEVVDEVKQPVRWERQP